MITLNSFLGMRFVMRPLSECYSDMLTVHFMYRMMSFKDEELSRIVSIATFLLGRLRPPHDLVYGSL